MPDEEGLRRLRAFQAHKDQLVLNAWLTSTSQPTGFSTKEGYIKMKEHQDWTSYNCQFLALNIPHLTQVTPYDHDYECPCQRFAIDALGDHLHSCCTQHAGDTMGAHHHRDLKQNERIIFCNYDNKLLR